MGMLDFLRLPETRDIPDLDAPGTTLLHARIIQQKPFLRRLYVDFYSELQQRIADIPTPRTVVELGSGGGFLKEIIPDVITTDVLDIPTVDLKVSAMGMPFPSGHVDAFLMVDVFHHISRPREFLQEVRRCLKKGGKVVMIEPANTVFGRFIYQNFHHEPFDPSAGWGFPESGPLSGANGAQPWIIFQRDRQQFEAEFPDVLVKTVRCHTPLRYLLSGGLTLRQLVPSGAYGLIRGLEHVTAALHRWTGMFVTIELIRH